MQYMQRKEWSSCMNISVVKNLTVFFRALLLLQQSLKRRKPENIIPEPSKITTNTNLCRETHWVSHILKALDHFVRRYAPILHHLVRIQSSDSLGIHERAESKDEVVLSNSNYKIVKYACLLLEVLHYLNMHSLAAYKDLLSL